MDFDGASIIGKARLLHGGKVATRSVITADGEMKSLGLMHPGTYRMTTEAPETIEILEGNCRVKLAEEQAWNSYQAGDRFAVPANSGYEIEVEGVLDYVVHHGEAGPIPAAPRP
ncbi:MAG TPA: pyrimidine/purine nucleoside phosphorylase [Gammaproteobacteria bacterium]|nr:pyrimidine/purine nucleoside phosphorylase [Gammaproteobacteria bacterium]